MYVFLGVSSGILFLHLFFCSTLSIILDELFSNIQRLPVLGILLFLSRKQSAIQKNCQFDRRACSYSVYSYSCLHTRTPTLHPKKKYLSIHAEGRRKKKLVDINEVMHKCFLFTPHPRNLLVELLFFSSSSFSV